MAETADQKTWASSDLIQIKAENEEEVQRRIEAFISNKRNEIDEQNIREYINPFTTEPESGSARTEAIYLHREGEKSHISLKRVDNAYGPQTRLAADDGGPHCSARLPVDRERAEAVEERLVNMELHLNMQNDGRGIFERLKSLEKRISFLEGLSPEYFTNGIPSSEPKQKLDHPADKERKHHVPQVENLSDVTNKIMQLKQALKQKLDQQADFPS
ncbi:MAP3K12-binding inhibitory protein 1 [Elysia marginata]|uniref:MAP3K12-binding inhibitory protein 1 n=1 Tax=Elysia marginata TaxID=1093978 RepID=A0AAV4IAU4_9GAST|nr:MAP3K12-binding inhibitory protein 1 [Elysia marginata]